MNRPTLPELTKDLCELLSLKDSLLASLIGVTEVSLSSPKNGLAYKRLSALYSLAHACLDEGVPPDMILNLLDEPFDPSRDDSSCLLSFITTDQDIPIPIFMSQLKNFKENL